MDWKSTQGRKQAPSRTGCGVKHCVRAGDGCGVPPFEWARSSLVMGTYADSP